MTKRLGIAWLVLECFSICILAWAELTLRNWSSVTHEDIAASPDAVFNIQLFSWMGAVALGVVMGLGLGAFMMAIVDPKSFVDGVRQKAEAVSPWLLVGTSLVAVVGALSLRHLRG